MATALLHFLFFAAAMWGAAGSSRFPDRPDAIGAGANSGNPDGYTNERRITVRLLSEVDADPSPSPAEALISEIIHTSAKLNVTGPDSLPLPPLLFAEEGSPAAPSDAELMARAKLVGIYESQIRARIERAWTLPADYRREDMFSCRVNGGAAFARIAQALKSNRNQLLQLASLNMKAETRGFYLQVVGGDLILVPHGKPTDNYGILDMSGIPAGIEILAI